VVFLVVAEKNLSISCLKQHLYHSSVSQHKNTKKIGECKPSSKAETDDKHSGIKNTN